jgi:1,3-beta-glucan synthase
MPWLPLPLQDVPEEDFALLGDLIAFGDGGFFCDRIITPVFDVIAYEVRACQ